MFSWGSNENKNKPIKDDSQFILLVLQFSNKWEPVKIHWSICPGTVWVERREKIKSLLQKDTFTKHGWIYLVENILKETKYFMELVLKTNINLHIIRVTQLQGCILALNFYFEEYFRWNLTSHVNNMFVAGDGGICVTEMSHSEYEKFVKFWIKLILVQNLPNWLNSWRFIFLGGY